MDDYLKDVYGIDVQERINKTPSIKDIEENLNRPMQGIKTNEEYYHNISSVNRIP